MKKQILAFAAALLTSAVAYALPPAGNIYSITPISTGGTEVSYEPGDRVQFRVRLLASDWNATSDDPHPWGMVHIGVGSEIWDDVYNPLSLGVVVSGRLCEAKIVDIVSGKATGVEAYPYTDLICEYKVQSSDLALPLLLALEGSTTIKPIVAGDETTAAAYYFFNSDKWELRCGGDKLNPWYCTESVANSAYSKWRFMSEIGERTADYSLAAANLRIKAIDFDKNEDSAAYWREVRESSSECVKYTPTIETVGTPTNSISLYVWTEDETIVRMSGDAKLTPIVVDAAGHTLNKYVTTVKVIDGKASYPIEFWGVAKGASTEVVLSPTLGYQFDAAGNKLENYLTRKVFCTDPPKPSVQICFDPARPTASKSLTVDTSTESMADLAKDAKPLYIWLSKANDVDMTVTVKVENLGKPSEDPIDNGNIGISANGSFFDKDDLKHLNVEIKAGDTLATLYLYPLGGDVNTQNSGIKLTPVLDLASTAKYPGDSPAANYRVKIAPRPAIVEPAFGAHLGTVSPVDGFTVPLLLNACYRDFNVVEGFDVSITCGSSSLYSKSDVRFSESIPTDLKIKEGFSYDAKNPTKTATIKVTTPDGRVATSEFTFTVAAPKTVSAEFVRGEEALAAFDEGIADAPIVRFRLSEPTDGKRYAYLQVKDPALAPLVESKAFDEGVLINSGETESILAPKWAVRFLDGTAETEAAAGGIEFDIILKYEDGTIDDTYAAAECTATVANVPAAVAGVYLGDTLIPDTGDSPTPFEVAVPSGVEMTYNIKIDEPSPVDMGAELVTIVRWTTDRAMTSWTKTPKVIKSSDALISTIFPLTMPETTHRVKIVTLDKDTIAAAGITDADYASGAYLLKLPASTPQYNFVMKVATAPHVIVDTYGFAKGLRGPTMDEKGGDGTLGTEKTTRVRVRLSEPAEGDLTLHLVAIPNNTSDMGTLEFYDCASSGYDGEGRPYIDLVIKEGTTEPENNKRGYKEGLGVAFKYTTLDGTVNSYVDGWTIEASIKEGGYEPDDSTTIYVQNLAPTIAPEAEESPTTNTTKQAGIPFDLKWKASDVAADLNWVRAGGNTGLRAEWYINGELQEDGAMKPVYFTTTDWQTTKITLDEGFSTVELRVFDKDADDDAIYAASRKWLFAIPTQKRLIATPIGPQENSKTKYRSATGRGLGRVWANGGNPSISAFTQSWSYRIDKAEADVWAYGYPAGDYVDDGSLGPVADRDIALDVNGEKWVEGAAYYPIKTGHDSFFYSWAYIIPGENGGAPTIELGVVQPTSTPDAGVRETVALDPYDEKKVSYASRQVEAIFSRELLSTDNMGDINGDGIPDLYLGRYVNLGIVNDLGTRVGDDLTAIGGANADGDMLPGDVSAAMGTFIPGVSNNWNRAFTNRDEIRGVGSNVDITIAENERVARHHFNDGPSISGLSGVKCDVKFTDPTKDAESTISELEYIAFTNWCGRVGKDPTDETLWATKEGWSPENPTDPTLADTDNDGMPDGYEYYFWYKAHVGEVDRDKDGNVKPETYRRMTGRKYVPTSPWEPEILSSDYLETLCNPNIRNSDFLATTDTDNDGITDLDEFFAGTNPFDFDTDHDGLPDGYELAISKTNPLKADSDANPDGDQMAVINVDMFRIDYTNSVDATGMVITNSMWTMSRPEFEEVEPGVTNLSSRLTVYKCFIYSIDGDGNKYYALGRSDVKANSAKWEEEIAKRPVIGHSAEEVKFLHFQVYQHNGFNPTTAWNTAGGAAVGYYLEHRTDTQEYTTLDEFMSMTFFMNVCAPDKFGVNDVEPKNGRTIVNSWVDYGTDPLNADTDGDGVPDGWEMYVMGGGRLPTVSGGVPTLPMPNYDSCEHPHNFKGGTEGRHSPLRNWNGDREDDWDGLNYVAEFSSTESCLRYEKCETIKNQMPKWINKYWPTDPWNPDSDGDGVSDGSESFMIYGNAAPDPHYEIGVQGGGMNPNSWDTDLDRLPDGWEYQYAAAIVKSESFTTSVRQDTDEDGNVTVTTNSVAEVVAPHPEGGMDPTDKDAFGDLDNDGLNNWQEYMVGAMRCWRYDDTTSPWTVQAPTREDLEAMSDDELYEMFFSPWSHDGGKRGFNTKYNPYMMSGTISPLNYFSLCPNSWDLAAGGLYMLHDGVYHDLSEELETVETEEGMSLVNRWGAMALRNPKLGFDPADCVPLQYISCDPRNADTDGDGMDDYYELFHGLNPLLGASGVREGKLVDIVHIALYSPVSHPNPPSAKNNYWITPKGDGHELFAGTVNEEGAVKTEGLSMDFVNYPWLNGLADADPDGDNISNNQEMIMPGVQAAPTYQHTDPTPLWMTDSSYTNSIVARSYFLGSTLTSFKHATGKITRTDPETGVTKTYSFDDLPWLSYSEDEGTVSVSGIVRNPFGVVGPLFDFEENEGYDSDHDYLSDFEESQGKTKSSSDPQVSDSPIRHQAMYFNGVDAFLQTPLPVEVSIPVDAAKSEFRQNYLYYTVEAWVKPDLETIKDEGLHTVIERVIWTGESHAADESFLRKNFLIGVKNGRWYTKFDSSGTDAKQPIEIKDGDLATTKWTHVVATFGPESGNEADGTAPMALKLYVNGKLSGNIVKSGVQPEHGMRAMTKMPSSKTVYYTRWHGGHYISTIVGASARTFNGIDLEESELYDYDSFFKGYIDEVRLWDGARSAAQIKSDYDNRVRYTAEMALDNRQNVYKKWVKGVRRSPQQTVLEASSETLPPELLAHWTFDHLPSAVDAGDVLKTPAGYSTSKGVTDAKARWSRPDDYLCGWWQAVNDSVRSSVFTETDWVPWVGNTVAHLPFFDGGTLDSILWHKNYYGMKKSLYEYAYPNSAEPVSRWMQQKYSTPIWTGPVFALDKDAHELDNTQVTAWNRTAEDDELRAKYRFTMRNRLTEGNDLLPMGGAYAKRISIVEGGMWDDGLTSDAWAQTGADEDNNGLPDWWEEYAKYHYDPATPEIDWDTTVTYNGQQMPAWQAYMRDMGAGMLPDCERHPEYADTRDDDRDGMLDWWEDMYGINTNSPDDKLADADGDGLSNVHEFLISEIFGFAKLNPTLPCSDGKTLDYMRKVGDLYLGEIFTDHDGMDNSWEAKFEADYINHYKYDPNTDKDGDGWSNYAEFRAGTDPSLKEKLSINGYTLPEHPTPIVRATVSYNGNKAILAPVVFMAWNEETDMGMKEAPDAVWTIGGALKNGVSGSESSASSAGSAAQGGEMLSYEKFLGSKPTGEREYYLSGGAVAEGSFKLLMLDKGYVIVDVLRATGEIYGLTLGEPDDARWFYRVYDRGGKLVLLGNALGDEEVEIGTIDYETGKIVIDFDNEAINGKHMAGPVSSSQEGGGSTSVNNEDRFDRYHYIDLANSYVKLEWKSTRAGSTAAGTYYLTDADKPSDDSPSRGYLREGKTSFACFFDQDGDGKYSPGELYGFVRGVDVGWQGAEVNIEVTEMSPVFARVNLLSGESDRELAWGIDSGDVDGSIYSNLTAQAAADILSGGKYNHIRVVPFLVSGTGVDEGIYDEWRGYEPLFKHMENRVVAEFDVNTEVNPFITEANFIRDGKFDIDWDGFSSVIDSNPEVIEAVGDVTAVKYRLVLGKEGPIGPVHGMDTQTVVRAFSTLIERRYEPRKSRTLPSALNLSEGQVLTAARPTFRWKLNESTAVQDNAPSAGLFGCSYTAFQIQVWTADEKTMVYDSGLQATPTHDAEGYFAWTAPLCAGSQTELNKLFTRAGNWKWRVAMYNAKFLPQKLDKVNGWSSWASFSTAVNQQQSVDDHRYGAIKATVKYAGPDIVLTNCANIAQSKGIVRVLAFTGGDFSGDPAAEAIITNKIDLVNTTDHTPNAELAGLKAGRYYVAAYIDSNGNHKKDVWESWGCCKDAVVVTENSAALAVEVNIDDADTDGDWLPDAYEYVVYGDLDHKNAYVDPDGGVVLKTITYTQITNATISLPSTFPATSLVLFRNFEAARLLLGLEKSETTEKSIADIRKAVEKKMKPGSVSITSMEIDPAKSLVTLKVKGEVEDPGILASIYTLTKDLSVRIYRKSSLVEKEWSWVNDYPVTVYASTLETTVRVEVNEDLSKSGFYMVQIVNESEVLKEVK